MDPRATPANWQTLAQPAGAARLSFASARSLREAEVRDSPRRAAAPYHPDCYPSLPLWPARPPGGPAFCAVRNSATFRAGLNFPFSPPANALWMAARNPTIQGRTLCSRTLYLWQSFPLLWQVACPMTANVPFWAGWPERSSRMSRAMTRFSVPVSALEPGSSSSKRTQGRSGPVGLAQHSTNKRGSLSCTNPLSSPSFCQRPCRVAWCRTTGSAPLSVLAPVRLPLTPWAMTRSRARPLALAPVRCAVKRALASANNPCGRSSRLTSDQKAIRGNARVAFFVARPAEGGTIRLMGRDTCSRRS